MERPARRTGAEAADVPARVLGIDPGTVVLGWGVVEGTGGAFRHIASGSIRARGTRADRLGTIHAELAAICLRVAPTALSMEQTFVGDNVQSAFRLGEARGAVMVAASQARVPVAEYSPAQIKVAVAGSGRAAKMQMQRMVARLLALDVVPSADEADALGAAICHLVVGRYDACVAAAGGWRGIAGAAGRRAWRR